MDDYSNRAKKNNAALAIGFFLVTVVALITVWRYSDEKQETARSAEENSQQEKSASVQKSEDKISPADLAKKISSNQAMEIIDIRSPEDFAKEHIINSKNISAQNFFSTAGSLDKKKDFVIVDAGGSQSAELAASLSSQKDSRNIFYLEGGISAWKEQFNPVVGEGDPQSFSDQAKVKYIKSDDLKKMIGTEKNLLIIDVRKSGSFSDGHIKGAINIFLEDLEKEKKNIPFGRKIVLYDNDGLWAFKGAVRLFDMGIYSVQALSDGLDGWKQKGFEVVK